MISSSGKSVLLHTSVETHGQTQAQLLEQIYLKFNLTFFFFYLFCNVVLNKQYAVTGHGDCCQKT